MAIWVMRCGAEKRDREAAKRFFQPAVAVVGHAPERVRTDDHDSYPRAIRQTLGSDVLHRTNRSLNHRVEQDHRGIKERYDPMRGFGSVASASRFCRAFDEVRQFFRARTTLKQPVSLAQQREVLRHQLEALKAMVLVASHPEGWRARSAQHVLLLPVVSVLTHPPSIAIIRENYTALLNRLKQQRTGRH